MACPFLAAAGPILALVFGLLGRIYFAILVVPVLMAVYLAAAFAIWYAFWLALLIVIDLIKEVGYLVIFVIQGLFSLVIGIGLLLIAALDTVLALALTVVIKMVLLYWYIRNALYALYAALVALVQSTGTRLDMLFALQERVVHAIARHIGSFAASIVDIPLGITFFFYSPAVGVSIFIADIAPGIATQFRRLYKALTPPDDYNLHSVLWHAISGYGRTLANLLVRFLNLFIDPEEDDAFILLMVLFSAAILKDLCIILCTACTPSKRHAAFLSIISDLSKVYTDTRYRAILRRLAPLLGCLLLHIPYLAMLAKLYFTFDEAFVTPILFIEALIPNIHAAGPFIPANAIRGYFFIALVAIAEHEDWLPAFLDSLNLDAIANWVGNGPAIGPPMNVVAFANGVPVPLNANGCNDLHALQTQVIQSQLQAQAAAAAQAAESAEGAEGAEASPDSQKGFTVYFELQFDETDMDAMMGN